MRNSFRTAHRIGMFGYEREGFSVPWLPQVGHKVTNAKLHALVERVTRAAMIGAPAFPNTGQLAQRSELHISGGPSVLALSPRRTFYVETQPAISSYRWVKAPVGLPTRAALDFPPNGGLGQPVQKPHPAIRTLDHWARLIPQVNS